MRNHASYLRLAIAAILGPALMLACCGRQSQNGNTAHLTKAVRVAFLPISASIGYFVAEEQRFFEAEGITIIPLKVTSANQAMDAILSDQADVAIMLGFPTLFAALQQDPDAFKIIQSAAETETRFTCRLLVRRDSPIHDMAGLRGRRVGTYSGLTQRQNLTLVLRHYLEPDKDVTIVQVEPSLQLTAFASGQFDALFTIDPYATAALVEGIGRVLIDNPRVRYINNPFPTAGTVASRRFLARDTAAVLAVTRALELGTVWADKNPGQAARILSKPDYTPISFDVASKAGTYEWWNLGGEDTTAIRKLLEIEISQGLQRDKVRLDRIFMKLSPSAAR